MSLFCLVVAPAHAVIFDEPASVRAVICHDLGVSLDAEGRVKPNDPACPDRLGLLIMRSWFKDPGRATHWESPICNPPPTPKPPELPTYPTMCAAGKAVQAGHPLPPEASLQLVAAIELLLIPHREARERLLGGIPEARRKQARRPLSVVPWLVESLEAPSFFEAYWERSFRGIQWSDFPIKPPPKWLAETTPVPPGLYSADALLNALQFAAPEQMLRDARRAAARLATLPEWPPDYQSGIPHWEAAAQAALVKDREARGLPSYPGWEALRACGTYGMLSEKSFPGLSREMARALEVPRPRLRFACGYESAERHLRREARSLDTEEARPHKWCVMCTMQQFFYHLYQLPD